MKKISKYLYQIRALEFLPHREKVPFDKLMERGRGLLKTLQENALKD